MKRWSFDDDALLELVIKGKKKATASVYEEKEVPQIGEENIITRNGIDACKIRITGYKVFKFKEAKEEDVVKEGEGNLEVWRKIHIDFFNKYHKDFNEDTLILFEEFELVEIYE
ncbi:MAG: ASCH domain-containing protein [Clostridia bacterium]|nr:ASCH domain-containing protein [Clostridia bacterium]